MILLYPAMETIVHEAATEQERIERRHAKLNEACGRDLKSVCVWAFSSYCLCEEQKPLCITLYVIINLSRQICF